jgi:hypothetical protein
VQQAEEAEAEAEAERERGLGLPGDAGVVEGELGEGVAQLGVVGVVGREDAGAGPL